MARLGRGAYVQKNTFRSKILKSPERRSMSSKELVETALRVLAAWIDGRRPAPADLSTLRNAFPSSAHLPDDDLACQVIHDLHSRAFRETTQVVTPPSVLDEVA
jgi:hypothetical protein